MDVVFTDLDGTLLDRDTYAWEPARPAIERLRQHGVPWILVTSKTRTETEFWRRRLGNAHPFIVENGGAAFLPLGYFPNSPQGGARRDPFDVLEWGTPYHGLVAKLQTASRMGRCRVRGFHEMKPEELAELCGLPLEQAVLAKQREYDEPFLILEPGRAGRLTAAIEAQGLRWTRGSRFWHILGDNDKAAAVKVLSELFEGPVRTIGLGDGLNDASFLNAVAVPVLIRSPQVAELKAEVPHGLVTDNPGPAGWNEAVLSLIGG